MAIELRMIDPTLLRRGRGKSRRNIALIDAAVNILREIYPASVRAVCYRLFTMNLIASMSKGETDRVSEQLTWAREQGVIPWSWIVDATREPERVNAFENPQAYIRAVKRSYRRDRWADQSERVEVWSEKSTVSGSLAPVLQAFGVTARFMHGYASATAVYDAARDSADDERPLVVIYVGDFDPSGLHMSEVDLPRRLSDYGGEIDLIRVALTKQDTLSGLPSFATESKRQDARYRWYLERYGPRCWELDALSPVVLRERVEDAIREHLDLDAWERAEVVERAEIDSLSTILDQWPGSIRGQAPE